MADYNELIAAASAGRTIEILKDGVWQKTPGIIFSVPVHKYRVRPLAVSVRVVYTRGVGYSTVINSGPHATSPKVIDAIHAKIARGESEWITDWLVAEHHSEIASF